MSPTRLMVSSMALCSLYFNCISGLYSFRLNAAEKRRIAHSFTLIRKTPLFRPCRSFVTTRLIFWSGGKKTCNGTLGFIKMVSRSCQKSHSNRSAAGLASSAPRIASRKACLDQRPGSMRSRSMNSGYPWSSLWTW